MKLYDEIILKLLDLTKEGNAIAYHKTDYPEVSDRSMILRSDMAYELGTELFPGFGATLFTDDLTLIPEDRVITIGPDLPDIKEDGPYARLTLVRVDDALMGEGQTLYNSIRKLEYVRYHFYPLGFMMRVSSSKNRESVRVGKEAIAKGLNFETVGSMLIDSLKEDKRVTAACVIYITDPEFDYSKIKELTSAAEDITKTIDHIFSNVNMDCNTCNLQEVCDEVEGLKELHFAQNK